VGKTKTWSVCVVDRDGTGVLQTTHGYVGSKQTTTERIVTEGKNLGKKNATTALTQAIAEAASDWKKKKEMGGYAETVPVATVTAAGGAGAGAETVEVTPDPSDSGSEDAGTTGTAGTTVAVIKPMLAHSYDKRGKDIQWPCYAQRKLDGVRCLVTSGGKALSRNTKAFAHLDHIQADVNRLPAGTILDGELYSDTLGFQQIVGLVKKTRLKSEDGALLAQIHLCVYDLVVPSAPYEERKRDLERLFGTTPMANVRLLTTEECATADDVKRLHASYVAEGYEGLILRNKGGKYLINHRSKDLQKYKEFLDEEFVVTGFTVGEGVEAGCVIWTCATTEGKPFSCRPRGTHEQRQEAVKTAAAQIGKKLSIRFQEWTDDKKPRFPVGIAFRDYE
jgi:ATP-dependent DNA ligase